MDIAAVGTGGDPGHATAGRGRGQKEGGAGPRSRARARAFPSPVFQRGVSWKVKYVGAAPARAASEALGFTLLPIARDLKVLAG